MAERVLFDITAKVLSGLGSLALQEVSLASNVKAELNKLKASVSMIKAVLLDAEEPHNINNHGVTVWLRHLKNVMYDVDDLLDDFSTEALQRKTMKGNELSKEVCIFFSKSNQLAYHLKMGHRVKVLRQKLDDIAKDRLQFNLRDHPVESQTVSRETHSFVRTEEVVGRDNDKSAIINLLLETNPQERIRIIPIVGIGGLGKTTLAQMVFNDEKVKARFELKMWVCVSDKFDIKIVAEKILEAATQNKPEKCELETLQNRLRHQIEGKKYFLVLDDVWNEDEGKWSMVKNLLLGGTGGSRIVVTTRSELVGRITCTTSTPPYFLEGLSKCESLSLFKQIAFEKQIQTSNHPDLGLLESFGEKIISHCAGVPLAIRAIGSILHFKTTKVEWSRVVDNISQQGTGVEPILRLSYDNLPSHLKQCFAYCSLFPKDYEINKHVLINLWMAQGFIQSPNSGQSLEDVGHDCFMDLLWRSFFQGVEEDEFGNIKSCKMHDLMHDLAKSVAGIECSLINLDEENVDENTRHVSLSEKFDCFRGIPSALLKTNKIRTFFRPFCGILNNSNCSAIIKSFRCSRMLDLKSSTFEKLPPSICKLKHLRYLDLSRNHNIIELPNYVTRLQNLQTLDLSCCSNLIEWPTEIGNMVTLRHLDFVGCGSLTYMPHGLGRLTSLRTLKYFIVSQGNRSGRLSELNGLNNLRGSLQILCLEDAFPEIGAAYLEEKSYLEALELSWGDDYGASVDDEMVLESLRPHPNLKMLVVQHYMGAKFPIWLSSITNLVKIDISCCENCQNLPPMDHLPFLKSLILFDLIALEHVSATEIEPNSSPATTFFPSLEYLFIHGCLNLKGWWKKKKEDDEESTEAMSTFAEEELLPCFPCLSTLVIHTCPVLTLFPPFPTLNNLLELRETCGRLLQQRMRLRASSSSGSLPFAELKSLSLRSIDDLGSVLDEILQKGHCTCLESLEIEDCGELTLFPDEVHALTSLHSLKIYDCPNLMALPNWISNLISLQELRIWHCPNLPSLPEGMSQLTDLRVLEICGCPDLSLWCTDVDWAQICHIPDILIY